MLDHILCFIQEALHLWGRKTTHTPELILVLFNMLFYCFYLAWIANCFACGRTIIWCENYYSITIKGKTLWKQLNLILCSCMLERNEQCNRYTMCKLLPKLHPPPTPIRCVILTYERGRDLQQHMNWAMQSIYVWPASRRSLLLF